MSNAEMYHKLIKCGYTDVWLPDMEFLPYEQMDYRKHLWNDTLQLDDLTVFAIDAYGNLYAWKDDDSVVFIDVGPGMCQVFSLNLADAIYRRIIEFSSGEYVDMCSNEEKADLDPDEAEYYTSENDAVELLKRYLSSFGSFFSEEQNNYIKLMIQNGFLPDVAAFITEEEQIRLIHKLINPDKLLNRNIAR